MAAAVSNAGPLIALGRLDLLHLLQALGVGVHRPRQRRVDLDGERQGLRLGDVAEGPLLDLAFDYERTARRILDGALGDLLTDAANRVPVPDDDRDDDEAGTATTHTEDPSDV